MKSPNISIQDNPYFQGQKPRVPLGTPRGTLVAFDDGFTLIETMIVIGLIGFIAVIGVVIGIDSYQRYNIRGDLDRAAVLLQKARSSAINNVGETSHGVYFGLPNAFVLYRGTSYSARNPSYDLLLDKNPAVTVTPAGAEIVFAPLSGASTNSTLTVSDGVRNLTININNEGAINW